MASDKNSHLRRRESRWWEITYIEKLSVSNANDYSLWKATKTLKQPEKRTAPGPKITEIICSSSWNCLHTKSQINSCGGGRWSPSLCFGRDPPIGLANKKFHCTRGKKVIEHEVCSKKAPWFDLFTGKIPKELPEIIS